MSRTGPGEFGTRLRRLREAAALSQEELAGRARLTAKAVSALERGERRRPYPATVRALADALALTGTEHDSFLLSARGLPPSASDLDGAPTGGRPESHADQARGRSASPLPAVPTTPIIGRERETDEVVGLLGGGARLVTITGPSGVGKTRLAWHVAARLRDSVGTPVTVELAPVGRVELVLPTIARAVGLQAGVSDLPTAVAGFLGDRPCLLLLDNLEHLLDTAADIAGLLASCPGLVVLATSRAPLRIRAEQEYPLQPLAVPPGSGIASVLASPAARMFADRARAGAPAFSITERNAADVAAICRRLDGLPLALELAAAHTRLLTTSTLFDRLDAAVGTSRLRDLPLRQQTLTATLDWSHALLTEQERSLLGLLSVFAGGFELDELDTVAAGRGIDVTAALAGLLEQSLVTRPANGPEGRFRLLEPVRRYAAERLMPAERERLAQRHAAAYAALAAASRVGLRSLDQQRWLNRLDAEHANLQAALGTLIDSGQRAVAARIGADTWVYWALRGHAGEGLGWWSRIVPGAGPAGDDRSGQGCAELALAGLSLATGDIGAVRRWAGQAVDAILTANGTDAAENTDAATGAEARLLLAMAAVFEGDLTTAGSLAAECVGTAERRGDPWLLAHARIAQGQVALLRGDHPASAALLAEATLIARRAAGPFTLATALNTQATLALQTGDVDAALELSAEAAAVAAQVRTSWTAVYTVPALAAHAARNGQVVIAAQLFGAAAAIAEACALSVSFGPDRAAADAMVADVRSELGEAAFRTEWERGRSLELDEIVELVPAFTRPVGPG